MALKYLLKFLFLAFVLLTNAEEDCKHKICVDISEDYFLSNPLNCSSYFFCRQGRAHRGYCPDGQFFHPPHQKCDNFWNVPCQPIPEFELECIDDEEPSQPPEEPPPEEQEFLCPSDEAQFLQHPHDCSKYILCFHRVAHVRHCASGLEWHGAIEQCNTPDQAQCSPSQCPIPDNPNQPVFLYNDNQCGAFALCVNGMPQWRSCAPGFHWDRVNNLCTTPEKAECEEIKEPPVEEIECLEDSPLRNPHPTECNLYFLCIDQQSFMRNCAENLIFDYLTRTCTLPEDGLCYADIGAEPAFSPAPIGEFDHLCENGGGSPIREHPDTCLKFIVCDFDTGSAWPLPCADGHVFVRELYACVPGDVDTCQPHDLK
ncbi:probable chitinase 10 [Phlebotomus argentipes]|uniref:probable chitinase 10 n=1 Tax=Phlebotomus argentipes TaxID=94469 RepID=UPI002892A71C|nr:probable chitinase 10 [Phlebotomus argentipes]